MAGSTRATSGSRSTAVRTVPVARISEADARRAGEADADAVRRRLGDPPSRHRGVPGRVPPDRSRRAARGRGRPRSRRDRRDRPAAWTAWTGPAAAGPWTRPTLALIATQPGVVSTSLAEILGRERFALKSDIRKLKRLGLTLSLDVGYELSRRGRAYLDATS